ncbi:hypothetical protein ESA94_02175 [Lacibacter luteus]|uniref:Lipoprotein n=1 Tax=Lacibacter luteus TaxID=2508719 RepID=A0A4Q1CM43_9BACT|nr:hypothetical protein [Lacibacter luteus]RXK61844.1 hypothetical protein ESA94_02175 [Lacibacter luteus]
MRNTTHHFTASFLLLAAISLIACAGKDKNVRPSFSKNYSVVIQDVMATAKFANADVKVLPVQIEGDKKLKANISLTLYNSRNLPVTEKGLDSLARRAIKIFAEPITNLSDFEKIKVCFKQEEQFPKIDPGKRCEYIFPLATLVGP